MQKTDREELSMSMEQKHYAYLPEDILEQMLDQAPQTAKRLSEMIRINDEEALKARKKLEALGLIEACPKGDFTESIMASDGANIVDRKESADIILAIAAGVDGLSKKDSAVWPKGSNQYQQWQSILPHHTANSRLSQGIMFLMELGILTGSDREIRIMDGSHVTMILKLNSLLSANDQDAADKPYVAALSDFLKESYGKIIPDIPDMIKQAFSNEAIVSLTKYSSSREIIDGHLKELSIKADDKAFMAKLLEENEYTKPLPAGQNEKARKQWKGIHIKCNLDIEGVDNEKGLNPLLEQALRPFKITETHDSELFFCYYKAHSSVYLLEIKKSLAENKNRLQKFLRSVKRQIIFPEIREPYPQYLADIIAKNISFGMEAVRQAIYNDQTLSSEENFNLIADYRTR